MKDNSNILHKDFPIQHTHPVLHWQYESYLNDPNKKIFRDQNLPHTSYPVPQSLYDYIPLQMLPYTVVTIQEQVRT